MDVISLVGLLIMEVGRDVIIIYWGSKYGVELIGLLAKYPYLLNRLKAVRVGL